MNISNKIVTREFSLCAKNSSKYFLLLLCLILVLSVGQTAVAESLPKTKGALSKNLRSMSRVYMAYGEYSKAEPFAEQALAVAKSKKASDDEIAMCLIDLAFLYNKQDKLFEAENNCRIGLGLQRKELYKYHPNLAYTLRLLASIQVKQGEYEQAKQSLDEALTIIYNGHTDDDFTIAPIYVDYAKLLEAQGKLEEAEAYYSNALEKINKCFGKDHLYKANVLENLADLYLLQERFNEAEPLVDQALAINEKSYGQEHHLLVPLLLAKAKIEQFKGNKSACEEFLRRASIAVRKTGNITTIVEFERRAQAIRKYKHTSETAVAKAKQKKTDGS
jgi:tetratricopeptide (TPR) repeat protein